MNGKEGAGSRFKVFTWTNLFANFCEGLNRSPRPKRKWARQKHGRCESTACVGAHISTYTLPAGSSPRTSLAVPAVSAFPVPVPFLRCG